ncbi:hypothetical protein EKO27_g2670 [Xylaria grammica]|uniref:Ribosome biogenesis protein SLX9 n=1 Tax=Xylaria grammica TaxID=363999 RepID=A0A439DDE3_9PEZI|nr:hypothetical protein EKO27_g2670 [Xylaria grammica]
MAPVAPSKRGSLRAKLAAKAGTEPHAPRKAPRPNAVTPSVDGFTSTKKDKRIIKHSTFISRIEKTHRKPLKRRRPGKKLVANLESLAEALPDLLADGETEEGLRQLREGKIRHKSLKMRKGALKKKEKLVRGEMDRFSHSLARLNSMSARNADADIQVERHGKTVGARTSTQPEPQTQAQDPTVSTTSRWAALRGFISSTMEQNPAFLKQDGK